MRRVRRSVGLGVWRFAGRLRLVACGHQGVEGMLLGDFGSGSDSGYHGFGDAGRHIRHAGRPVDSGFGLHGAFWRIDVTGHIGGLDVTERLDAGERFGRDVVHLLGFVGNGASHARDLYWAP